jgi:hypothetical protein
MVHSHADRRKLCRENTLWPPRPKPYIAVYRVKYGKASYSIHQWTISVKQIRWREQCNTRVEQRLDTYRRENWKAQPPYFCLPLECSRSLQAHVSCSRPQVEYPAQWPHGMVWDIFVDSDHLVSLAYRGVGVHFSEKYWQGIWN